MHERRIGSFEGNEISIQTYTIDQEENKEENRNNGPNYKNESLIEKDPNELLLGNNKDKKKQAKHQDPIAPIEFLFILKRKKET